MLWVPTTTASQPVFGGITDDQHGTCASHRSSYRGSSDNCGCPGGVVGAKGTCDSANRYVAAGIQRVPDVLQPQWPVARGKREAVRLVNPGSAQVHGIGAVVENADRRPGDAGVGVKTQVAYTFGTTALKGVGI